MRQRRILGHAASTLLAVTAVVASLTHGTVATRTVVTPVTMTASSVSTSSTSLGFAFPADIYWDPRAQTTATFDLTAATRMKSVRLPIFWGLVQPVNASTYDWSALDRIVDDASSRGLGVLGSISSTPTWAAAPGSTGPYAKPADPAVFGRFAAAVAARYRGKISAYEIWNEPNGSAFYNPSPDAISYTGLLKAGYRAIKGVDPATTVVGGALGAVIDSATTANPVEFLRQMYAAGAAGSFDAFSFHPYKYELSFSAGWTTPNSPGQQLTAMRQLMIANGDGEKKIWATEYGVPSTGAITEGRQNALIGDFTRKWKELPYAGPVFFFTDRDRATGNGVVEDNFGLLRTDRYPKDAMWTVAADAYLGVDTTPEYTQFQRKRSDPNWGQVLSPVVPVGTRGTQARFYQNVGVFETSSGFITAPAAVADRLAPLGLYPLTPFSNGYQDLVGGSRAYYSQATGAHLVGGGVAAAWSPAYGLALTDEIPQRNGQVRATFEHGFITWDIAAGGVGTRTS